MRRRTKADKTSKKSKKTTFVAFVGCEALCMEDVLATSMLAPDPVMLDCDEAVPGQQWEVVGSNDTPGAVFQLKGASGMCVGLIDCFQGDFDMVPCTNPTTKLTNPLTELTLGGGVLLHLGCWKEGISIFAVPLDCTDLLVADDVFSSSDEVLFLESV
jgi:hypothetical protein